MTNATKDYFEMQLVKNEMLKKASLLMFYFIGGKSFQEYVIFSLSLFDASE